MTTRIRWASSPASALTVFCIGALLVGLVGPSTVSASQLPSSSTTWTAEPAPNNPNWAGNVTVANDSTNNTVVLWVC